MPYDHERRRPFFSGLQATQPIHEERQIRHREEVKAGEVLEVVHTEDRRVRVVGVIAVGRGLQMTAPNNVTPQAVEDPTRILVYEVTEAGPGIGSLSLIDHGVLPVKSNPEMPEEGILWNSHNYLRRPAQPQEYRTTFLIEEPSGFQVPGQE